MLALKHEAATNKTLTFADIVKININLQKNS